MARLRNWIAICAEREGRRIHERAARERERGGALRIDAVEAEAFGFDDVRGTDIFIERAELLFHYGPCTGDFSGGVRRIVLERVVGPETYAVIAFFGESA